MTLSHDELSVIQFDIPDDTVFHYSSRNIAAKPGPQSHQKAMDHIRDEEEEDDDDGRNQNEKDNDDTNTNN